MDDELKLNIINNKVNHKRSFKLNKNQLLAIRAYCEINKCRIKAINALPEVTFINQNGIISIVHINDITKRTIH